MEATKRRVSKPWIVQRFWDAILFSKEQKQVPKFERIYGFLKRRHGFNKNYCEKHLRDAIKDHLVHVIRKTGYKGSMVGEEQESFRLPAMEAKQSEHDWYCFQCHDSGDVWCCSTCFRVYHPRCLKEDAKAVRAAGKFICPICKLLQTPNTLKMKKDELNTLLSYTCRRLKEKPMIEIQQFPYAASDEWRTSYLICNLMNLNMMEEKTQKMKYSRLEEFQADAENLCHNIVVFYGADSPISLQVNLMLQDCIYDLGEIRQCHDCYRMSNEKNDKLWFCQPCNPPHELVYAKVKGFQFWPAKVIRRVDDVFDVRFFGGFHERAKVELRNIKPITSPDALLGIKRCVTWDKACEELSIHQELLKQNAKGSRQLPSKNNNSNGLHNGDCDDLKSKPSTPKSKKKIDNPEDDLNASSSGITKPVSEPSEPRRYKSLRLIMRQLKENEETEKLTTAGHFSKALKRNEKNDGMHAENGKKNETSKSRQQIAQYHIKSQLAVSKELKKLTKLIDEKFETNSNEIDTSYTFSFKGNGRISENINMLNSVGKRQSNGVSKDPTDKPITRRAKDIQLIDGGQPLHKKLRIDTDGNLGVTVKTYLSAPVGPFLGVSILKPLALRRDDGQNQSKSDCDVQNKRGNPYAKNYMEVTQDEVHILRNDVQNNDTGPPLLQRDIEPFLEYSVNNVCSTSETFNKCNDRQDVVDLQMPSQLSLNSDNENLTKSVLVEKHSESRDNEAAQREISVDLVRICDKDMDAKQIKFKFCENERHQDRPVIIVASSKAPSNVENDKNTCEAVTVNNNCMLNEKTLAKDDVNSTDSNLVIYMSQMLNQKLNASEAGTCFGSASDEVVLPTNEGIKINNSAAGFVDMLMDDQPQKMEVQMEDECFAKDPTEVSKEQEKVQHQVSGTCADKTVINSFGNETQSELQQTLQAQHGITSSCFQRNEDATVDPITKKQTMNLRAKSLRDKSSKSFRRPESDCEMSASVEMFISSSAKSSRQLNPAQEDHNVVSSSSQETTYSNASIGTQTYRWSCRTISKYIQTDPERFASGRTEAKANAKAIKEMKDKLEADFKASKERLIKDMTLKLERKHNEDKERAVEAAVASLQKSVADMRDELQKFREFHELELKSMKEKHLQQISEVKKKQWCYNCESEAIYHCCWNTSYCSTGCQQVHWQKEHKRNCRRKR